MGGADPNRVEGTDPIRSSEVERTHSLHPNRPDQAIVNRSDSNQNEAATSTRAPSNAPIPATMTNVQPDPSAPITQGDFSCFLDKLQSTKKSLEAQRRDNHHMQET